MLSLKNKIKTIEYGACNRYVEYVTFPNIENTGLFINLLNVSSKDMNIIKTAGQNINILKFPINVSNKRVIENIIKEKYNEKTG